MGRHFNLILVSFRFILFVLKIPPAERSTIPPAAQSGANIGTIFTTPLISIMVEGNFLGGWPSAFYVFGKKNSSEQSISLKKISLSY